MYQRLLFVLLLIASRVVLCGAQVAPPIPRFQTIGVNDGLSQGSVYALYQDKRGFMWIGTGDGLNRYDGSELRTYRVPVPAGNMPSSFIRGNLCEDDSGNIWFANENGVYYWSAGLDKIISKLPAPQEWKRYGEFNASLIKGHYLWLFNPNLGAARFDIRDGRYRFFVMPDSFREDGTPMAISSNAGPDGRLWFKLYLNGAIYYFDTRTASYGKGFSPTAYTQIFFGKRKHYLLSASGFSVYDSSSGRSEYYRFNTAQNSVGAMRLAEDRWGRAWMGTFISGLYCYEPHRRRVTSYQHSNVKLGSLPIDLAPTVYIDRADNLWVGTDGGGVSRLDLKPPRFNLFPLNEGDYPVLKDYFVKCFYEDKQGNLWFGTHNNGLCVLNMKTGALEQYTSHTAGGRRNALRAVAAIVPDAAGRIWISHETGFSIFDRGQKRFEDVPVFPRIPTISSMPVGLGLCAMRDGRMLGATYRGPVLFTKKSGRWCGRSFTHNGAAVTSACQTADGSIWMSTKGAGLLQMLPEADSFRVIATYFKGINLRGLHPDEQHPELLWVASSNGFAELNIRTGKYRFRGEADGMSNAFVYGMLEDAKHNFWMSTNGGLIHYDRRAEHFSTYTYADGLQSNEFNSGAYYRNAHGRMYFGGVHGFNWFEPDQQQQSSAAKLTVVLQDVTINGQPRVLAQSQAELSLPYTQNNIAFRIAVLDYSRPEANKVSYFLEGWDKGWIESRDKEAHYSNLPPGSYKLHIKGCNSAGTWSDEETLQFLIKAPFWETSLFYVLMVLAGACVIAGFTLAYIRRKTAAQQLIIERQHMLMEERARISKDMHDEIGSGLTRIAMMSEMLQTSGGRGAETQKISAAARSLVQSMSEIIWALNPAQDSVEGLLSYLREQIHQFLEPFNIHYSIDFPENVRRRALSNVQRRNIYLTAKEAVNNVMKHANAAAIQIIARTDGGMLCFEVSDNGSGFSMTAVRRSANGLRNMQRRMEEIGGYFHCESLTRGTRVSFGIPLAGRSSAKGLKKLTTFFTSDIKRRENTFEV